jgi:hypothetical protein
MQKHLANTYFDDLHHCIPLRNWRISGMAVLIKFWMICLLLLPVTNYLKAQKIQQQGFTIGIGMGYGMANGLNYQEDKSIGGFTGGAEAGYRLNHSFMVTFHPYVWVEGNGMFNNNAGETGTAKNSRFFLLLKGYYFPFKKSEAFISISAGAANYFFTPGEAISTDQGTHTFSSTKNVGVAGSFGIGSQLRLGTKGTLRPSMNLYLCHVGNLKFTTGETLANDKPSAIAEFTLGIALLAGKNQ